MEKYLVECKEQFVLVSNLNTSSFGTMIMITSLPHMHGTCPLGSSELVGQSLFDNFTQDMAE